MPRVLSKALKGIKEIVDHKAQRVMQENKASQGREVQMEPMALRETGVRMV